MEFQYMKSLNVLDTAVADVINQLVASGVMNNTYILFASDNGGCPGGGGRNAPLRGTKGSLFEGNLIDTIRYRHYFDLKDDLLLD